MAKKSGGRQQKTGDKSDNQKGESQQQSVDPEDQPKDIAEELGGEPLPQGPDPKDSQSSGTDSKNLSTPNQSPKGQGTNQKLPSRNPKEQSQMNQYLKIPQKQLLKNRQHGTKQVLLMTLSILVQLLLPQRVYLE